jgi:L-ascorbate metabolism protein UlaG (beta-lactamase superfamily)
MSKDLRSMKKGEPSMMTEQCNRSRRLWISFLAIGIMTYSFAGAALTRISVRSGSAKSDQIKIVYIANQGYLVEIGDKKILIDALHTGVSPDLMAKMTSVESPFDKVDIILTTQSHADHFSPDLVAKHMDKNKRAVFISNDEAASHVRAYISDFASAAQRIKAMFPMDGEKIKESFPGFNIHAMSFPLSRDSYITSLGFLVSAGGKKILHMGDSAGPLEYINAYKLAKEKIDVAFIPYRYFSNPDLQSVRHQGEACRSHAFRPAGGIQRTGAAGSEIGFSRSHPAGEGTRLKDDSVG